MKMKVCAMCGKSLPLSFFRSRSSHSRYKQPYCDDCKRKYDREWYRKNREKSNTRRKVTRKVISTRNREYLDDVLIKSGCIVCGVRDVRVLEFHHRDPSKKDYNVSELAASYSLDRIQKEIDKCDVLCANCHRIEHSNRNVDL